MQKYKEKHGFMHCFLHKSRVLVGRGGFEPPDSSPSTVFKKLTAFPISSLTLPNRVGFYPKNRPFLHVFCIFARNLRENCEKTLPPINLIFFIFSSVSSSANFE